MNKDTVKFLDKYKFVRRCLIIFVAFFLIFLNLVMINGYMSNGASDDGIVKICLAYNAAFFVYISFYTYTKNKKDDDDDENEEDMIDP